MRRFLPYLFICADILIARFHYLYYDAPPADQWFIAITELVLRIALWQGYSLLTVWKYTEVQYDWLSWRLIVAYFPFLALDFFQQVMDKNHGQQNWEVILYLTIAAVIFGYGKIRKLV